MKLTIFDVHARHGLPPALKFLLTWGAMISLPIIHRDKYAPAVGALYILVLVVFFGLRIKRFILFTWKLVKGFVFLLAIIIIARYLLSGSVDTIGLVNAGIFIEVLIIGIVFSSVTTASDYLVAFGFIRPLRGITYAYRAVIQLIEDMLDELAVIRSRQLSLARNLPRLAEKYLILTIKRAVLFSENCRLKGTMPWLEGQKHLKRHSKPT